MIWIGRVFLWLCVTTIGYAQSVEPSPPGRLVNVDGVRMHIHCMGSGQPTVVLEAGLGDSSLVWTLVQRQLAKTGRVCSYDRAGTAWSYNAGPGHGLKRSVGRLHDLLKAAGEPAPFVLVGHSWGGWLVAAYAREYRADVAGLVIVDSTVGFDPPVVEKMPEGKSGGPPAGPLIMKPAGEDTTNAFKRLPPDEYRAYLWTQTLKRMPDVDDPDEPLRTVNTATQGRYPLGSLPLIVIAARQGSLGAHDAKGQRIRKAILNLSTRSRLVFADSGHHVQLEKPGDVVKAVGSVISQPPTQPPR